MPKPVVDIACNECRHIVDAMPTPNVAAITDQTVVKNSAPINILCFLFSLFLYHLKVTNNHIRYTKQVHSQDNWGICLFKDIQMTCRIIPARNNKWHMVATITTELRQFYNNRVYIQKSCGNADEPEAKATMRGAKHLY